MAEPWWKRAAGGAVRETADAFRDAEGAFRSLTGLDDTNAMSPLDLAADAVRDTVNLARVPINRAAYGADHPVNAPYRGGILPSTPKRFSRQGGGGGGIVEDAGAVTPSYQPPTGGADQTDPFAELASVQVKLAGMAGQLDAGYQSRLEQLREAYQFAETAEEKAQLAFMLENIEGQRSAGQQVIQNAYGAAIEDAGQRASAMRATAGQEAQQVGDLYRGAADRTAAGIDDVAAGYEDSGLGVGAVPVSGDATDFVHLLNVAAPREQALTQRLGNIAAEDVAFLGQAMAGEQNAQTGDLERLAMQLAAQTQAQHQAAVNQRIAQERQMFAGQQFALGNRYEDRRWDLGDTSMQIELDRIAQQQQAGGAAGAIPTDERERTLFGLGLLSKYGAWAAPILQEYGLLPPGFDPSMVPGYVPPEG